MACIDTIKIRLCTTAVWFDSRAGALELLLEKVVHNGSDPQGTGNKTSSLQGVDSVLFLQLLLILSRLGATKHCILLRCFQVDFGSRAKEFLDYVQSLNLA